MAQVLAAVEPTFWVVAGCVALGILVSGFMTMQWTLMSWAGYRRSVRWTGLGLALMPYTVVVLVVALFLLVRY